MNDEGIFSSALQFLRKIGRIASFPVKRRSQAISDEVEPSLPERPQAQGRIVYARSSKKYDAS